LREEFDFPIFLKADPMHILAKAIEAAKAKFDSVVFDASAQPFEQNVRQTKEAVEAVRTPIAAENLYALTSPLRTATPHRTPSR
jgi:fructose/tagatose bisphosphate aldolase